MWFVCVVYVSWHLCFYAIMEKAAHFIATISTHIGVGCCGEALFIPMLMNNPHFLFYQVFNYCQQRDTEHLSARPSREYFFKELKQSKN